MHVLLCTIVGVVLHAGCIAATDTTITVTNTQSCHDVSLSKNDELNIEYYGADVSPPCTFGISSNTTKASKICISLDIDSFGSCLPGDAAMFKVKYVDGDAAGTPAQMYSCDNKYDQYGSYDDVWCTAISTNNHVTVSVEGTNATGMHVFLHVYITDDELLKTVVKAVESIFHNVVVIVCVTLGVIVLMIVGCIAVCCYCCHRQRGASGVVYQHVPQPVAMAI